MKKVMSMLIAAALVLVTLLSGCSGKNADVPASTPTTENKVETKTLKIVSQMFYDPLQQQYMKAYFQNSKKKRVLM